MIRIGMFIDDRYEVLERIGSGGMSDVYKAKDHKLNRFVAVKFLKPEFSTDKNFVSKFKIEAQNAAALLHPNVVSVYDVSEYEGIYFIVMEYVDGITLKEYIEKNGRLPVKEATSIAIQVAQGIEAAHNANIIHRDIKPQNVLISRTGKIKVTDFGIARTTTANTMSQDILGSVHYISPEQARGGVVAEQSDIYSFGILFYEMITGKLPYEGDSTVQVALKHIQENVPLASDIVPGVPSSVVKIIEKCTQKKPERRYQKVSSLISDLKTSLISPNEDFVVLEPEMAENATILMSGTEARYIKDEGGRIDRGGSTGSMSRRPENTRNIRNTGSVHTSQIDRNRTKTKFDKALKYVGIIAAIIVVIILVIVCIKTFGSSEGCAGGKEPATQGLTKFEMIDVTGMELNEAKQKLADANFRKVKIEYDTSNDVEEDHVISQSVDPGEMIEANTQIVLTVCSGKDQIIMDDFRNMKLSEAQNLLDELGFKTRVITQYDDTIDAGKVIKTDPDYGSKVDTSQTVLIYVSKGAENKMVEVPDVRGYGYYVAQNILDEHDLDYYIEFVEDENNVDLVIRMTVEPGTEVEEGTMIGLYVGKMPEETEAPETEQVTTEELTTQPDPAEETTEAPGDGEEQTLEPVTDAENPDEPVTHGDGV